MNQPLGEFGYNMMMPGLGAPMLMGPDSGMGSIGGGLMGSMGGGYPPSQFGGSSTGTGGFF
jgi:hypothetical protein